MSLVAIESVHYAVKVGFWMNRKTILNRITFGIDEGSVTGFLGPNGAGKTSLIQLMVGVRRPSSGSIRIGGHPAQSREARAQVGFLPERPYFPGFLTARQILNQYGQMSGLTAAELKSKIPAVLERVGVAQAIDQELRTYSKGMLQRLGVAQAILHEPKLLILDEPMSGLDPVGRYEMRALIQQEARQGRTIFFSSHVVPDVEAICDRLVLIQRGAMVRAGSTAEIIEEGQGGFEIWFKNPVTLEQLRIKQPAALDGEVLEISIHAGRARLLYRGKDIMELLQAIKSVGGIVQSVTPVRTTLEQLFVRGSGPV